MNENIGNKKSEPLQLPFKIKVNLISVEANRLENLQSLGKKF